MNKQAKIALIGVGVVVIGGVTYYVWNKQKQSPGLPGGTPGSGSSSAPGTNSAQNILNSGQNVLNTVQSTVQSASQIANQYLPTKSAAPAGAPNLQDGMGIRVTDGPYNGYVYLYSVGELGPIKQWVTSGSLLNQYFGNGSLSSLLSSGKVINVSSSVANQIPEAAKLTGQAAGSLSGLRGLKGMGNGSHNLLYA